MTREAEIRGCAVGRLVVCMLMGLALLVSAGCSDSDDDPVVGSMVVDVQETDAMFVETVLISMPFKAIVYNGTERKIVIRGEDNLIDKIKVVEKNMSDWEITAPFDFEFEQHEDIIIEIPFIEMVSISRDGEMIEFGDDPIDVWNGADGGTSPEG